MEQWKIAVAHLREATSSISEAQKHVAAACEVRIPRGTPRTVAAAKLRAALAAELRLKQLKFGPVNEHLLSVVDDLKPLKGPRPKPSTDDEASAWIEHLFMTRRLKALLRLRPEPGDVVVTSDGNHAQVSSVGQNGRLHFLGGMGHGAWPDTVQVLARNSDQSMEAAALRIQVQNAAAQRRPTQEWSYAKDQELREYYVRASVDAGTVMALENVIESAADERPIQDFLASQPGLLALLVPRDDCYVIPQPRLGSQFVPDFLLADIDSAGVHWHLIELENPRARMFLGDGRTFSKEARKGIDQITDWRDWLQENLAYARKRRGQQGLGLIDIKPDSPALVLVGRRSNLANSTEAHRIQQKQRGVQVHTYDWLLESLRSLVDYEGHPLAHPARSWTRAGDQPPTCRY